MRFDLSRNVAVGVANLAEAEEFYTRVMGWEVQERGPRWVGLSSGAVTIYLCDDNDGTCFDVPVENAPAALAYLTSNGCTKVREINGEIFVRDPYGMEYCLSQGGFEP